MTDIMVDVEADGPIPGDYSMIVLGAVVVERSLSRTFYAKLRPISDKWVPEALAVSGFTREETLAFPPAIEGVRAFHAWLREVSPDQPRFMSDNNGFDWMFYCYYAWHFDGRCPFGYSSTNIGSLYKGLVKDRRKNFKHLRKTKHTHNPVDDCKGNAEAVLHMQEQMGLR